VSDTRPRTLEGMQAKARAAKAEALMPDGSEQPDNTIAAHWSWEMMNDLLQMPGGAL
jgi:hypothetical protein